MEQKAKPGDIIRIKKGCSNNYDDKRLLVIKQPVGWPVNGNDKTWTLTGDSPIVKPHHFVYWNTHEYEIVGRF